MKTTDLDEQYSNGYNDGYNEGFEAAKKLLLDRLKESLNEMKDLDAGDVFDE